MKVLVIGGAGYIGSHVVSELLNNDYEVVVYDNLLTGKKENLFEEATFIKGDILDYGSLYKAMEGCEAIIHLAGLKAAGESMINIEKYSTNNISGTVNILNAASFNNIKRIVFSSSAAVYGEPKYLPIDEDHITEPENYYGATKLEIERLLKWYDKIKNIKFAALRYFNAAGYDVNGKVKGLETNPQNLLPIVMETASGIRDSMKIFGDDYDTRDGTCIRDYVHVNDLADAHVKALNYINTNDESLTVNLGSETGVTVNEMINAAMEITKVNINVEVSDRRPGDPAVLVSSASKAYKVLGWKPKYSDVYTLVNSTWNVY
jgi:UDP-glucose 4-epimerase